jgi:hypothetical protein
MLRHIPRCPEFVDNNSLQIMLSRPFEDATAENHKELQQESPEIVTRVTMPPLSEVQSRPGSQE